MSAADESLPSSSAEAFPHFQVHAYSLFLRLLGAAAWVLSAANLLHLVARILYDILEGAQSTPPLLLALRLVAFSLVPLVLAWLIQRFALATVYIEPMRIVMKLRRTWFEIPFRSIAGFSPWKLPLPGPGLGIRLKSGRRFPHGLQLADPTPLLEAIGNFPTVKEATEHPTTRYARARHAWRSRRWDRIPLKFGLFPLVPTVIMFRAHQYIAYGGLLGEYHLLGLQAYLKTFAGYWLAFTTSLVLYAGTWRILAEGLAFAGTWAAPSFSRGMRRATEWLCRLAYYGGFPAFVAARFLL